MQAQEKLQACQLEVLGRVPLPKHVGRAYLETVAGVLEEVSVKLAWRARFSQLVAAARGLKLHPQTSSPRTLKASTLTSSPLHAYAIALAIVTACPCIWQNLEGNMIL